MFRRPYIANPDLVDRLTMGAALTKPDPEIFFTGEAAVTRIILRSDRRGWRLASHTVGCFRPQSTPAKRQIRGVRFCVLSDWR
jgi:hypothetical protein